MLNYEKHFICGSVYVLPFLTVENFKIYKSFNHIQKKREQYRVSPRTQHLTMTTINSWMILFHQCPSIIPTHLNYFQANPIIISEYFIYISKKWALLENIITQTQYHQQKLSFPIVLKNVCLFFNLKKLNQYG